ncbi:Sugct [Symbiodinium pilosum]|uniref:Sugct protein n=1 Tax=Symbiodinium pilosum TaxID=2952 RepID=A0A812WVK4_SYMPI|nr:Sugct [Symbiodinium pilosum]
MCQLWAVAAVAVAAWPVAADQAMRGSRPCPEGDVLLYVAAPDHVVNLSCRDLLRQDVSVQKGKARGHFIATGARLAALLPKVEGQQGADVGPIDLVDPHLGHVEQTVLAADPTSSPSDEPDDDVKARIEEEVEERLKRREEEKKEEEAKDEDTEIYSNLLLFGDSALGVVLHGDGTFAKENKRELGDIPARDCPMNHQAADRRLVQVVPVEVRSSGGPTKCVKRLVFVQLENQVKCHNDVPGTVRIGKPRCFLKELMPFGVHRRSPLFTLHVGHVDQRRLAAGFLRLGQCQPTSDYAITRINFKAILDLLFDSNRVSVALQRLGIRQRTEGIPVTSPVQDRWWRQAIECYRQCSAFTEEEGEAIDVPVRGLRGALAYAGDEDWRGWSSAAEKQLDAIRKDFKSLGDAFAEDAGTTTRVDPSDSKTYTLEQLCTKYSALPRFDAEQYFWSHCWTTKENCKTRSFEFDGAWSYSSGCCNITCGELHWQSGLQTVLQATSDVAFNMELDGEMFQGKLAEGGSRLVFSDGDVGRLALPVLKEDSATESIEERGAALPGSWSGAVPSLQRLCLVPLQPEQKRQSLCLGLSAKELENGLQPSNALDSQFQAVMAASYCSNAKDNIGNVTNELGQRYLMRSPTYCGRFCNAPVDQTAKSDLTPAGCDKTRCGSGEALLGPSAGPTRGREELNSHSVEAECRETIVQDVVAHLPSADALPSLFQTSDGDTSAGQDRTQIVKVLLEARADLNQEVRLAQPFSASSASRDWLAEGPVSVHEEPRSMPTELDKHTEAPPDSLPALDAVGDCKGMSNHVDLGVVEDTLRCDTGGGIVGLLQEECRAYGLHVDGSSESELVASLAGLLSERPPQAADAAGSQSGSRPLQGVRIVEACSLPAGPFSAAALAALGAQVLKLELDPTPAMKLSEEELRQHCNRHGASTSEWWCSLPQPLALNLELPLARQVLEQIVAECNCFIHSFRVISAERLGLGKARLEESPHLMIVSLSGLQSLCSAERASLFAFQGFVQKEDGHSTSPQCISPLVAASTISQGVSNIRSGKSSGRYAARTCNSLRCIGCMPAQRIPVSY